MTAVKCVLFQRRALVVGLVGMVLVVPAGGASSPAVRQSSSAAPGTVVAVDRARDAGLAGSYKTWSATEIDYNRDGRLDVWISKHASARSKLWRNARRGQYVGVRSTAWPVRNDAGKIIDRHDCGWADVDKNGRPDAYCTTGRFMVNLVKRDRDNELWLQTRRGTFREVGTAWGIGDICTRGRNVVFINANGDRFPDLFAGTLAPRPDRDDPCNDRAGYEWSEKTKLFINTKGNGFRYAPRFADFGFGVGARCAESADVNGDGWQDLLACRSDSGGALNHPLALYHNRGGRRFVDVSASRLQRTLVNDAVFGDLDKDGDPDLITAGNTGVFYHRNAAGYFRPGVLIGQPERGTLRSVAVGDADLDGDPDVYGVVAGRQDVNPDDILWVNEDLTFTPVIPPSAGGNANEVIAVHPGKSRRAEFLVMNGDTRADPGPIQLIRLVVN
jgi:hypothetical protein